MKPPVAVTSKLPPEAENFQCGPEGTWYATVEARVPVLEGKKKVKRPRHRIHWLTKRLEVRVARDMPVFHEAAFDDDVALLTGDRGGLLQLIGIGMSWRHRARARTYSSDHGAWEILC